MRARALAAAVLLAGLPVGLGAARPAAPAPPLRGMHGFRTGTFEPAARRALVATKWQGGRYTTASGESVTVFVSDSYPDGDARARRWAEYFAGLVHGPELALVRAYVAPLADVQAECRSDGVLGCYGGNTLVTIGDTADGVAPEEVAAHEYGHHVALNRLNTPWKAIDWGTKRWATYMGVCGRVAASTAFPGDEGSAYGLNPGEAFAETYRVLNGANPDDWSIVDAAFRPDAHALELVREDVLHPWEQAARTVRGLVTRSRRTWTLALPTTLDGTLTATLRAGAGTPPPDLALVGDGGREVARSSWTGSAAKMLSYSLCGTRAVRLRVTGDGSRAAFSIRLSVP